MPWTDQVAPDSMGHVHGLLRKGCPDSVEEFTGFYKGKRYSGRGLPRVTAGQPFYKRKWQSVRSGTSVLAICL
jgi:hypothetical protein